MRGFFELYNGTIEPVLLASDFRARFGDEDTDGLLQVGVLHRNPIASWYRCGDGIEDALLCNRRVVEIPDEPGRWIALCRFDPPRCPPVYPKAEELEEYRVSSESLCRVIRELMGLTGSFEVHDQDTAIDILLGTLETSDGLCDVLLSLGGRLSLLLAQREAVARRSLILSPTPDGIPAAWLHRYVPGSHVVIASMVDFLDVQCGAFTLSSEPEELLRHRADPLPPFCMLYENGTKRAVTKPEAERVARRASTYDLFLNAAWPNAAGLYEASRRREDGTPDAVALPRRDVLILVGLVAREGEPVRATELEPLRGMDERSAARLVEIARKRVDLRLGRFGWRVFHTVRGDTMDEKRYRFARSAQMSYAVLAPLT